MRALIYVRVSLDHTGEGKSVERQIEACRALCLARGWDVIGVEQDNSISAYGGKARPGWQNTLAAVSAGRCDVVVAWHLDRMTRSMIDLEQLILLVEEHGVGLATATGDIDLTTDVGRMVARILAAVARAEVERKAARQKLAHEQRAAAGKPWTGGPRPIGYEKDRVTIVEREAEALRWAADCMLDGGTLVAVGKEWNRLGVLPGRKGPKGNREWSSAGVRDVLLSPRYAGIMMFRGEPTGQLAAWEPIFDMDTHLALKRLLSDPARKSERVSVGRKPAYLLSGGVATCSVCGTSLSVQRRRGVLHYVCASPQRCCAMKAELIEREVVRKVVGLLCSKGFRSKLAAQSSDGMAAVVEEADALRERLAVIGEGFIAGDIDADVYRASTARASARLRELDETIASTRSGEALTGLEEDAGRLLEQWDGLSLDRRRRIVSAVVSVEARPANGGTGGSTVKWSPELHLKVERKSLDPAA